MNSSASSSSVNSGEGESGETALRELSLSSVEADVMTHGHVNCILRSSSGSASNAVHHPTTDEQIYKMAPEAVDPAILSRGCLSMRRYTRSALLSIREDSLSKGRPECLTDPRLNNLGLFWQDSSRAGFRGSNASAAVNSNAVNNPKNVMDHRSISSSHLMPAFMKRRAVVVCKCDTPNNSSSGGSGPAPNAANETGKEQKQRKDAQHQQLQADIVLSPQRKSINMGCQMPSPASAPFHDRELQTNLRERRIGSGRLPPRDVNWDYRPEKESLSAIGNETDGFSNGGQTRVSNQGAPYRNMPSGNSNQEYREHRYDRRSFGRNSAASNNGPDFIERGDTRESSHHNYVRRFISDLAGNSTGNGSAHSFSSNDRRSKQYGDSRSDEPEWLNAGPISQHDTIELRGFDEAEDTPNYYHQKDESHGGHKSKNRSGNNNRESSHNKAIKSSSTRTAEEDDSQVASSHPSPPPARSTPTKNVQDPNNNMNSNNPDKSAENSSNHDMSGQGSDQRNSEDRDSKHVNLNFEEILKLDSLNDILAGDNNHRKSGSSRFSQWFKHSSPTNQPNFGRQPDSRRSSMQEELINILNVDPNQSSHATTAGGHALQQQQRAHASQHPVHAESSGEKYFVPISPTAASNRPPQQQTNHALLEFLVKNNLIGQNAQQSGSGGSNPMKMHNQNPCPAGGIPSVEELEARMRKSESLADSDNAMALHQHGQGQLNKLLATNNAVASASNPQSQAAKQNLHRNHNSPPPSQQQDMETFRKLINALQQQQQQQQHQQHQQIIFQQMLRTQQQQQQQQQQRSLQQHLQAQQQQLLQKIFQMNGQNTRNDVIKVPEAQSIIQGIARGDITQNSLLQQLASSTISIRDREIIVSVLNHFNQQQQQHQQHNVSSSARPLLSPSTVIQQHLQLQHLNKGCAGGGGQLSAAPSCNNSSGDSCNSGGASVGSVSNNAGAPAIGNNSNNSAAMICSAPAPPPTIVHQTAANAPLTNELLQSHLLYQQQTQKQSLSPLPNGLPQRIPSPRELQFHTQSIMQNALIKKKLEEQQENFRRRQEIEKQHHGIAPTGAGMLSSGGPSGDSTDVPIQQQFGHSPPPVQQQPPHNKQLNSPTPLAFTPTSVLRKMTAEKEGFMNNSGNGGALSDTKAAHAVQSLLLSNVAAAVSSHQHQTQPRMILGGGSAVQQHQTQHGQQNFVASAGGGNNGTSISPQTTTLHHAIRNNPAKWNQMNLNQLQQLQKPMGRPILKGRPVSNPDPTPNPPVAIPPSPQTPYGPKMEFHQQAAQQQLQQQHLQLLQHRQRVRMHQFQQMQFRQQMMQKSGVGVGVGVSPAGPANMTLNTADPQSANVSPNQGHITIPPVVSNVVGIPGNLHAAASSSSPPGASNSNSGSSGGIGINYQRDGGLSPTSNQLARWFSPELLAKASAGKLPSLNMGQALSLEEFERSIQHSSAAVHN